MKKLLIFAFCFVSAEQIFAQQDPQYSQYMFNQMAINPAYAGSKEAISASAFIRSQWTGIEGAPKTETVSIHAPLKKKKVGIGFSVIADQIGPKKSIGAMGSYAYRIPIKNGKLSFGLRAGVFNYTYNWDAITYKDQGDVYNTHNQTSTIVPTADAGVYYYTNTLYVGFSATHLYSGRLTTVSTLNGDNGKLAPHLFFTFGKAWSLSENLIFNPSLMVKAAKGSPSTADLNFSFLLKQRAWVGLSMRSTYGFVVYAQFNVTEKFKLGYSYDYGINKIGKVGGGSHEIMLGYDFNISKSKITSPRYL
ncbi:MAG TPA: type IX secretion system membrane protein PorP/SprF [Bacteroidia bacterium]|nr:type IX secretion system membrane protein PorP/SprF [Bacteroidia bacterium]